MYRAVQVYCLFALLFCCANVHALTSTRSTGFCVIWVCIQIATLVRVRVQIGIYIFYYGLWVNIYIIYTEFELELTLTRRIYKSVLWVGVCARA